jgi:hypothetical protein
MMERANNMLNRPGAYSAVYSWSATDGFILAGSATRTNGTNSVVDVPLPNVKLLEKVRDRGYGSKVAATDTMVINGVEYYASARCANANTYIDNLSGESLYYCIYTVVTAIIDSTTATTAASMLYINVFLRVSHVLIL